MERLIIGEELRMFRRSRACLVPVVVCTVAALWWSGDPRAQVPARATQGNPTAREIVDRFIELAGGRLTFKSVRSMQVVGSFAITGQALKGEVELVAARPNRLVTRINMIGIGRVEEGFDGKIGWSIDPMRGPSLVTGRALEERSDAAWFDGALYEPDHIKELTLVGREDFDKRPAYRIRSVSSRGTETFQFFDVETGFRIGTEARREMSIGIVPATTFYREYQRFGLLLFPAVVVQRALGQEQVLRFSNYQFNTVPENAFDLPVPIKALIKVVK
jgi:hypothetical protein